MSKKIKCEKNNDYGDSNKEANRTSGHKINNNESDSLTKLKFVKPRTVIGFDGKMVII